MFALGMLMLLLSLLGIRSNTVACVLLLALTAIVVLVLGYLWPMVVAVDVPLRAAIKNAAVLALAFPQHSLPALVVALLLYGLSFWLFPLSLPLVMFVPFGMGSFVTSFAAWSDIRRLVIRQNNR